MNATDISTAEHYRWGSGSEGWHLLKREDLSIIEERVPPGDKEQRHFHQRSRQFFYIIRGAAVIEIDGKRVHLRECQGVEIPPGVPHQFRNESNAEVVFLVVSAPMSHDDRVNV
ncbi:MAG: cupin domain-containing protein [Pseudomonadota bacterium]